MWCRFGPHKAHKNMSVSLSDPIYRRFGNLKFAGGQRDGVCPTRVLFPLFWPDDFTKIRVMARLSTHATCVESASHTGFDHRINFIFQKSTCQSGTRLDNCRNTRRLKLPRRHRVTASRWLQAHEERENVVASSRARQMQPRGPSTRQTDFTLIQIRRPLQRRNCSRGVTARRAQALRARLGQPVTRTVTDSEPQAGTDSEPESVRPVNSESELTSF
jgi:hypothetical protein